ncbi:MAG TPA: radical SAM family heme chaperone HemW [Porticoccaceae bacterium]|nr:radical SAM family heme chaperone HemW [Porticoccaceae bacterium]
MLELPPLTLYVHIPWCVRKCPYCDFNSHEPGGEVPEEAYLGALLADLTTELDDVQGRRLAAIFIGGGTPSLFSPRGIAAILDGAERLIGFDPDIEITLEANPGTLERGRFAGYRAAGVNRLSIGVQSFDNRQLHQLGRIHDRAAAIAAIHAARAAGFANLNLDLMHGLPGQTPDEALADLRLACDLDPTHLSWYQLTIEPNTVFHKRPPTLPDEEVLGAIQDAGEEHLTAAGLRPYEVSAWTRPGHESRHNLNYWRFGDYLGIGAGAHGKVTRPGEGRILRTSKTRAPADYLARDGDWRASRQAVAADELPFEFMMNALRLVDGVEPALYPARTGLDFAPLAPRWRTLRERGLVSDPAERLATTALGLRYLNSVLAALDD